MAKCVSAASGPDGLESEAAVGGADDGVCVATKSKKRKIKFVCKDGRQFRFVVVNGYKLGRLYQQQNLQQILLAMLINNRWKIN